MAGEAKIYALSTCATGVLPNCHNAPNCQKVLEIRSISLFLCAFYASLWPYSSCSSCLRDKKTLCACPPRRLAGNPWLINDLRVYKMLYNCKETFTDVMSALQIKLFMQNKAKFRKVKLNVNKVITKDYDKMDTWSIGTKQSQTNPNKAKLKKAKMNVTSILTVGYENKPPIRAPKKQSQISKRQKTMQTSLLQRIMKKTALSSPDKTKPNKPNFKEEHTR